MSRLIEGMILPGGWHYKDPTGYRIPHTSELPGPREVVDAILEFRLENQLPAGNPEADLENYVCTTFPHFCSDPLTTPVPNSQNQIIVGNKFVDIIALWANSLYDQAGRMTLVTNKEAEQRSVACMNCPMQTVWEGDCPRCVENAQRITKIVRQGKEVTHWRKLHGCAAQGFCTRTAVHIDRQYLGPTNPTAPDYCWMRKE